MEGYTFQEEKLQSFISKCVLLIFQNWLKVAHQFQKHFSLSDFIALFLPCVCTYMMSLYVNEHSLLMFSLVQEEENVSQVKWYGIKLINTY